LAASDRRDPITRGRHWSSTLSCNSIHLDFTPREIIASYKWAGRAEKIFVVVEDRMVDNGKAEALLKSFVDYGFDKWGAVEIDGMIVYEQ
jgi:hypothetical protein